MSISPQNPIIYQILKNCMLKDLVLREFAYDYDNCSYFIIRGENSTLLKMGFTCNSTKEILANGGQEMLNELYKEYLLPESENIPNYDITLGIDISKLPKPTKVKKNTDESAANQIKQANEQVKKEREKMIDELSAKFACFKRDFLGAPIRRALKELSLGAGNPAHSCEISYRSDEKYWVVVTKSDVSVSFALNFDN